MRRRSVYIGAQTSKHIERQRDFYSRRTKGHSRCWLPGSWGNVYFCRRVNGKQINRGGEESLPSLSIDLPLYISLFMAGSLALFPTQQAIVPSYSRKPPAWPCSEVLQEYAEGSRCIQLLMSLSCSTPSAWLSDRQFPKPTATKMA